MSTRDFFLQGPQIESQVNQVPGYQFLGAGGFGDIYISNNLMTILKVFFPGGFTDEQCIQEAVHEASILQKVARIAPEYVPAPTILAKVPVHISKWKVVDKPAIQMPNVGNTIRSLSPFDVSPDKTLKIDEIYLCILQSIHFLLLVNDQVKIDDLHSENLCVQWRGPNIRLRFIDVAKWHVFDSIEPIYKTDVIIKNMQNMFLDPEVMQGMWYKILFDYIHIHVEINHFIKSLEKIDFSVNVYSVLLEMAINVQSCIQHGNGNIEFITQGQILVDKIDLACGVARLSIRPSLYTPCPAGPKA